MPAIDPSRQQPNPIEPEPQEAAVYHPSLPSHSAPAGDQVAQPHGDLPAMGQTHGSSNSPTVGFQNLPDRGDSFPPNIINVPSKSGSGLDQIDLEQYRNHDTSLGNPTPMERIISHLDPKDLANARLAGRVLNDKLSQTGREFMDAGYTDPRGNLPPLLGKSLEPSEHASQVYKMAGLDPQTQLHTSLGRGSQGGKEFKDGGGFIGKHQNPAQTQEEADAQYETKLKKYHKLKAEGKLPPKQKPPKKLEPKQAAPSGAQFEYHPGGGEHSNKIPSSKAMGGAYFKVDPKSNDNVRKAKTGNSDGYRISRYGEFKTGKQTGHFYDPIPAQGTEGKLKDLSPEELIRRGSDAEKAGNSDEAAKYSVEARKRMEQKTSGE